MPLSKEILKIATLGTAHHEVDVSVLGEGEYLERTLLGIVAGIKLSERAGWIPMVDESPLTEPCPIDKRPVFNISLASHLFKLASSRAPQRLMLQEWCIEVRKLGKQLPAELIPTLLDIGQHSRELRDHILPLLGKRGIWLAENGSDYYWCWFDVDQLVVSWRNCTNRLQKIALTEQLRRIEPSYALKLLESNWESESSKLRSDMLEQFIYGLSKADEKLLENALDDSWEIVGMRARELLSRLPQSHFYKRMIAYADEVIHLIEHDETKRSIEITYLQDIVPSVRRDLFPENGLDVKKLTGRILGRVPVWHWCEKWHVTLDELFTLIEHSKNRHATVMWKSLHVSAYYLEDSELADELYSCVFHLLTSAEKKRHISIMSKKRVELALTEMLQQAGINFDIVLFNNGISRLRGIWDQAFTTALLKLLKPYIQSNVFPIWHVTHALSFAAVSIPIEYDGQFLNMFDQEKNEQAGWSKLRSEVADMLNFRREMLEALRNG